MGTARSLFKSKMTAAGTAAGLSDVSTWHFEFYSKLGTDNATPPCTVVLDSIFVQYAAPSLWLWATRLCRPCLAAG